MIEKEIDIEVFAEENTILCLWNFWIDEPIKEFHEEVTYNLYNLTKFNLLSQFDIVANNNYVEDADIDTCINKAYDKNKKYAIIATPGHNMHYSVIPNFIEYAELKPKAGLIAHLIDDGAPSRRDNGWFGIHPQVFLINLHIWEKIGKPSFGMPTTLENDRYLAVVCRAEENYHDDYTPIWYKPTDEETDENPAPSRLSIIKRKGSPLYWGWNIIHEIIKQGYECRNIPDSARKNKSYIYPDMVTTKTKVAEGAAETSSVISNFITGFVGEPFLFNTEYYDKITTDCIPFKNFILLPSGFKGHNMIEQLGYNGTEKVFFYDINMTSIHLRKYMIETWNGENFVDWLRTYMSDNPLFQIVKNENTFSTTSLEWYNNCWQEELKKWNGSNNFKSHWTKVHNNTHNILYLYWDIVHDIGKTKQVSQLIQDNSYMWISNIWDNGQLHNKNDANTIITKFNEFTNNIGTNVLLHGKDTTGDNIWKYYNE